MAHRISIALDFDQLHYCRTCGKLITADAIKTDEADERVCTEGGAFLADTIFCLPCGERFFQNASAAAPESAVECAAVVYLSRYERNKLSAILEERSHCFAAWRMKRITEIQIYSDADGNTTLHLHRHANHKTTCFNLLAKHSKSFAFELDQVRELLEEQKTLSRADRHVYALRHSMCGNRRSC